jgi:anti-anti-sigma factor
VIAAHSVEGMTHMTVQGEMTIYSAAELAALWLPWLTDAQSWQLDLAGVAEMDGAGLQLLLLAQRELSAAGASLHLIAQSPAVQQVLNLCQLTMQFGSEH